MSDARSLLALLILAWLPLACGDPTPARPNVLLVSIDTLRADHLGCYGYPRATSPRIDALAGRGVRFENAFSTSSWTLPAHMSIMTSLSPHVHGVDHARVRLPPAGTTLAQTLREAGYRTAGFASWVFTSSRYGFDHGFDRYVDAAPAREDLGAAPRADHMVDLALDFLAKEGRHEPFFLFVHLFDPHLDYDPPPPYRSLFDPDYEGPMDGSYRSVRPYILGLQGAGESRRVAPRDLQHLTALYDGEIRFADEQLGRLLAALDELSLSQRTLVIVTSDHGEELDDHGSLEGHQWTLYDEIVRVPLIVRAPGGAAGAVSSAPVSLLDVAPTVLELAGLPVPAGFEGRSLAARVRGGADDADDRTVFSETRRFTTRWSARDRRYKLIVSAEPGPDPHEPVRRFELYDLEADPREQSDLFRPGDPRVQPLLRSLRDWIRTRPAGSPEPTEPSREERERLRSLGYLE